ncbi:MAG TPA: rRNA adenine N-6-methyltransferase family protein [Candidatus Nanoarchaeia archaeon]|nr:rRNA adenine N-6-methyltransferase family protein [Candidatus Nanoarchaeia archaeon]
MAQDQHFMVDKELLKEVVEAADPLPTDEILEIGAGHGELTQFLARKAYVIAVELDSELVKSFPALESITLVEGNALKLWWSKVFNKVVGNIPYTISEPLVWLILKKPLERVTLVVGKDFAEILLSDSKLGILTREFYKVEVLKVIPKKAFFPQPRVDSALVLMKPKALSNPVLRELVWQSDKKIKNALEKAWEGQLAKKEVKEKLKELGEITNRKITQLSNEEFDELFKLLNKL